MARRHDAVLAAIPLLVLGGVGTARGLRFLEKSVGVGGRLAAVPFTALGLLAATAVIGRELFVRPPTEE